MGPKVVGTTERRGGFQADLDTADTSQLPHSFGALPWGQSPGVRAEGDYRPSDMSAFP